MCRGFILIGGWIVERISQRYVVRSGRCYWHCMISGPCSVRRRDKSRRDWVPVKRNTVYSRHRPSPASTGNVGIIEVHVSFSGVY